VIKPSQASKAAASIVAHLAAANMADTNRKRDKSLIKSCKIARSRPVRRSSIKG